MSRKNVVPYNNAR